MKTGISHVAWLTTLIWLSARVVLADQPDFRVNDDGGTAEQSRPRVAVAGDGSFAVTWVDKRLGNSDIFLQRFDGGGNPIGNNLKVNDDVIEAHQAEPALAVDLSGLYSLVFKDYRNGLYPFDPHIYFQRFDSAVAPIGANRNLTSDGPDSLKETPDIALATWGGGVVVWADYRDRNWDIYGQLISPDGTPVGTSFRVNDDIGTAQQHAPRVSIAPEGWIVVGWYDNRWGDDDIYVQRFDAQGGRLGANVKVNSDGTGNRQAFPDVAADGAGHFTVVWVDWRNGQYPADPDIYARKYDTTMVPLAAEVKVNKDGTARAQREPTISADRMGNVAVIWSDSAISSWDITGQMIDVAGVIREANFQANSYADSAQLQADVALDGRNRYVVWTDRRNGNWDIYASITKYNDPTLIPQPSALKFEMERGGPLPEPQQITVEHAGYNPLSFAVSSSAEWCGVNPVTGLTPRTLTVSISDDSLPRGSYFGSLTLTDTDNNDSTVSVSVRLDVTSPILSLSADTIRLRGFSGIDDTVTAEFSITNEGSGTFTWDATETIDWLRISSLSGVPPSSVELHACALELGAGNYIESVVINADGAEGSPAMLWVVFEVVDNSPYLKVCPDSLFVQTAAPVAVAESLVVSNLGVGNLLWNAAPDDSWLIADPLSGVDDGVIRLSLDAGSLATGEHVSYVSVTDSAAFNVSQTVPFVLRLVDAVDTLQLSSAIMNPGSSTVISSSIRLLNRAVRMVFPIRFDTAMVRCDSISLSNSMIDRASFSATVDSVHGIIRIEGVVLSEDNPIDTGAYPLADLHLTARSVTGLTTLDVVRDGSILPGVTTVAGLDVFPDVLPGEILIDNSTDAGETAGDNLPQEFELHQNYPNPFNMATRIQFEVPAPDRVRLDIFNVLGQKIVTLVDRECPVGRHIVTWDGFSGTGRAAASGIYFYRLQHRSGTTVRKMALVK
ncbi:MAG: T9SS type A sorting domain-containing protein [Candidatus Zixiibacteriota bacterium]|nr:MAG: T9SS type A sorting domain-containing protein [candidate division Zixibacteria bacterium]